MVFPFEEIKIAPPSRAPLRLNVEARIVLLSNSLEYISGWLISIAPPPYTP